LNATQKELLQVD